MRNYTLGSIIILLFSSSFGFSQNFSWGLSSEFLLYAPEYFQDYKMVQEHRIENYYETYFENGINQYSNEYKYILRYDEINEFGVSLNLAYYLGKKKRKKLKPFKIELGLGYFKTSLRMAEPNLINEKATNLMLSYDDYPNLYTSHELNSFEPNIRFHYSPIRLEYFFTNLYLDLARRFILNQSAIEGSDLNERKFQYNIYNSLPWIFSVGIVPGYVFKKQREDRAINVYVPISFSIYTIGNQNEDYWDIKMNIVEKYTADNFKVREKRNLGYSFNIGIGFEIGKMK